MYACAHVSSVDFAFCSLIFLDLIQDWSSDNAPDIFSFVPYTWNFKIMFHQFEMIWAANQHNWIDCSTKQQENGKNARNSAQYSLRCANSVKVPWIPFLPSFLCPRNQMLCPCSLSLKTKSDNL